MTKEAFGGYVILDAARTAGALHEARELNPDHTCLYEGDSERFLAAVAPWLFTFDPATEFGAWLIGHAAGHDWGIFLRSAQDPVKLYKHLRRFLIIESDDGREMYFRYYDPRVLRVFLPTCDPDQLKEFFGPIGAFLAEDAQGGVIEFSTISGRLKSEKFEVGLQAYFRDSPDPASLNASIDPGGDGTSGSSILPPEAPPKRWDFGF